MNDDENVYINSITYGRKGYLCVETEESIESIEAVIRAEYNNGVASGGGSAGTNMSQLNSSTRISVFLVGGDSDNFPLNLYGFLEKVKESKRPKDTAIVPISYKCKFLKDNRPAYVNTPFNYTETICSLIKSGTKVKFEITSGSDGLRNYNTAWFRINFTDGTSTKETLLLSGLGQNQNKIIEIHLEREVDLIEIESISIRHDGTPNNNPFGGGDIGHMYDEWDLIDLRVSLISKNGNIYSIYRPDSQNQVEKSIPYRFNGSNRIIILKKITI